MAELRELRKRIETARDAQKLTFAMKLVAASRFRKARRKIESLRPYALTTLDVLADVAARAPLDGEAHPLLRSEPPRSAWIAVLASNRGLAGAFNANVCRAAEAKWRELSNRGCETSFVTFGDRARQYFDRRRASIRHDLSASFEELHRKGSARFGRWVAAAFEAREFDACYLVYNEYRSVFVQEPVVWQLLPILPVPLAPDERTDFLYEPDKQGLLSQLLPMYLGVETYRAFLESRASESAARMVAMDAANKNAAKLGDKLRHRYNRARQEEITRELIEVSAVFAEQAAGAREPRRRHAIEAPPRPSQRVTVERTPAPPEPAPAHAPAHAPRRAAS